MWGGVIGFIILAGMGFLMQDYPGILIALLLSFIIWRLSQDDDEKDEKAKKFDAKKSISFIIKIILVSMVAILFCANNPKEAGAIAFVLLIYVIYCELYDYY